VRGQVGEGGLSDKPYEMGRTRVYFSAGVFEMLESLRGGVIFTHIKSVQRVWRGHRQRKLFRRLMRSALLLKRVLRAWPHRRRLRRYRRAVVALQTAHRVRRAKRVLVALRRLRCALRLQSWVRMLPHRQLFLILRRAATIIGRWLRTRCFKKRVTGRLATNRETRKMSAQLDNLKVATLILLPFVPSRRIFRFRPS
jgi:hypothetical protein